MGGIDWSALPLVIELLGITEPEPFISRLVAIRDWHNAQAESE